MLRLQCDKTLFLDFSEYLESPDSASPRIFQVAFWSSGGLRIFRWFLMFRVFFVIFKVSLSACKLRHGKKMLFKRTKWLRSGK